MYSEQQKKDFRTAAKICGLAGIIAAFGMVAMEPSMVPIAAGICIIGILIGSGATQ